MAATGFEKDIDLPGPRPRTRGTLLSVAREIPRAELVASGFNRLPAGVTWLPWGPVVLTNVEADCNVVYSKVVRDLPATIAVPAFLVYDALHCSTIAGMYDELWNRVNHNFEVGLSAAIARQLELGTFGGLSLQGAQDYNGVSTADYVPVVVPGTTLRLAVNGLENYLASKLLDSVGTIHLTPGLLALGAADLLWMWDEGAGAYRTATGTYVVGDAGFTGTSTPNGGAAGSTASPWVYATGDVWYAVMAQEKADENDGNGYKLVNRNTDRPLAEVYAVVCFDPNVLAAARVTVA